MAQADLWDFGAALPLGGRLARMSKDMGGRCMSHCVSLWVLNGGGSQLRIVLRSVSH